MDQDALPEVESSSLENGRLTTSREFEQLDFDIALRLEVKPFPTQDATIAHQLVLVTASIHGRLNDASISVKNLVDLGIVKLTEEDPDPTEDVICYVEDNRDMWARSDALKQVWDELTREIHRYECRILSPPLVKRKRAIRVAVAGLRYFKKFVSPDLHSLPTVYHSDDRDLAREIPEDGQGLGSPLLFK
jgi:hypothetical protein